MSLRIALCDKNIRKRNERLGFFLVTLHRIINHILMGESSILLEKRV